MKFKISGFDEVYDDYEKCKEDLVTMQDSAKADLIDDMRRQINMMNDGFDKMRLKVGLNFIRDCIEHAELGFEIDDDGVAYMVEDYIETIKEE